MRGQQNRGKRLQLWGGVECTVNRVGDAFFDQFTKSGHHERPDDIVSFAEIGISHLRQSVLWERVAPDNPAKHDWSNADDLLSACAECDIQPIVGLVHHGSGPRYTNLLDPEFPHLLASYAKAAARRYPWIEDYTPVNEPLTTARFSALYGVWYPHAQDGLAFAQALLNQLKGVVLSMEEIRKINPIARLIQTEDLGKTHSTKQLSYQAEFENERRWITWDLLCGMVTRDHAMYEHLRYLGIDDRDILWFRDNPCMPDVLGVNHYVTSERFIDHRIERYPEHLIGGNGVDRYADVEAVRVLAPGCDGPEVLLREAWDRYGLTLAVTECHLGCTREEQMRWLTYVWNAAESANAAGADVQAVTLWSLLGAYDWSSLLCRDQGCYESGVFDMRAPEPRPTALAHVARELSWGHTPTDPLLDVPGWWERPLRLLYPPAFAEQPPEVVTKPVSRSRETVRPLAITGASGTLGRAFARLCEMRGIEYRLLSRADVDLANEGRLRQVLTEMSPWAVINTAGFVRVDDAEEQIAQCFCENTLAAHNAARICDELGIPVVCFSSDLVFDGQQQTPYLETDEPRPLSVYGQSKVEAENRVLCACDSALVIRTSSFFGPWDQHNFLYHAVESARNGKRFRAAGDLTISPTYVPDLVHASLDLLIDKEAGIWHLVNNGELTWAELARWGICVAGYDEMLVEQVASDQLGLRAERPQYAALASERGWVMPSLEDALERWALEAEFLRQSSLYYMA